MFGSVCIRVCHRTFLNWVQEQENVHRSLVLDGPAAEREQVPQLYEGEGLSQGPLPPAQSSPCSQLQPHFRHRSGLLPSCCSWSESLLVGSSSKVLLLLASFTLPIPAELQVGALSLIP